MDDECFTWLSSDPASNDGDIRLALNEYSSRHLITRVQCLKQKPRPRVRIPTCIGLSFWNATDRDFQEFTSIRWKWDPSLGLGWDLWLPQQ